MKFLDTKCPCRVCGKISLDWVELSLKTNDCCCSIECLSKLQPNKKPKQLSLIEFHNEN